MKNLFRKSRQNVRVVLYKKRLILLFASLGLLISFLISFGAYTVFLAAPSFHPAQPFLSYLSGFTFGKIKVQSTQSSVPQKSLPSESLPAPAKLTRQQKQAVMETLEQDSILDDLPKTLQEEILQLLR